MDETQQADGVSMLVKLRCCVCYDDALHHVP